MSSISHRTSPVVSPIRSDRDDRYDPFDDDQLDPRVPDELPKEALALAYVIEARDRDMETFMRDNHLYDPDDPAGDLDELQAAWRMLSRANKLFVERVRSGVEPTAETFGALCRLDMRFGNLLMNEAMGELRAVIRLQFPDWTDTQIELKIAGFDPLDE